MAIEYTTNLHFYSVVGGAKRQNLVAILNMQQTCIFVFIVGGTKCQQAS